MANLIFKGIQQVLASGFTASNANSGVLYFVRNAETGDADIYFGKKHYGSLNASKLRELETAINTNSQDIKTINETLGAWAASFQGDIKTVAAAVVAVSGTSEENKTAIATLNGNGDGSVAKAVADAKADLEDKIQEVADSVTNKNVSAEGDVYVSATATGNKVTVAATEATKASLALADSALQDADKEELEGKITVVDNKVTALTETFNTYTGDTATTLGGLRTDINSVSAATIENAAKINALINSEGVDAAIESFNELNKWIEEHGDKAESMLTAITANTTAIEANANAIYAETEARISAITSLETTLKAYADQAEADAITAATAYANSIDTSIKVSVGEQLTELETSLKAYADQAEADAITAATAYTEEAKTKLNNTISSVNNNLTAYTATTNATLDTLRADVNTVSGTAANNTTAITNLQSTKLDATTYESYTASTSSVLESIKSGLSAITNNAVTSVASSGKTITVTDNGEGAVNVDVNTLAHAESGQDGYVILNKTADGALYGVMYYGGDDAE